VNKENFDYIKMQGTNVKKKYTNILVMFAFDGYGHSLVVDIGQKGSSSVEVSSFALPPSM
jgi:hypothetical protein